MCGMNVPGDSPATPTATLPQHTLPQHTLPQHTLPQFTQPQQPQQPQQLHTHIPPKLVVPSIEQGPRQGPGYSKKVAAITRIYTDDQEFKTQERQAYQGVPVEAYNSIGVG